MAANEKPKCIIKDCGKPEKSRGLCSGHLKLFEKEIAKYQTAEERQAAEQWYMDRKLVLPKRSPGREPKLTNPFKQLAPSARHDISPKKTHSQQVAEQRESLKEQLKEKLPKRMASKPATKKNRKTGTD